MALDVSLGALHREWWFRCLVSLVLALLLRGIGKLRKSQGSQSTSGLSTDEERLQRLMNSKLLAAGEEPLNDLTLEEEEVSHEDPGQNKAKPGMGPSGDGDAGVTQLPRAEVNERDKNGLRTISQVNCDNNTDETGDKTRELVQRRSPVAAQVNVTKAKKPSGEAQGESSRQIEFPQFLAMDHPGLDAFWHWWDVSSSLFRIYTLVRSDGVETAPPYNPSSRRGSTPIALRVTNGMNEDIVVYWVDYKGKYVHKGIIRPNQTWYQSTWIDHPWVFCQAQTDTAILHYIPYRVIPTTNDQPTVDPEEPEVGVHRFTIRASNDPCYFCLVSDAVLPFPARDFFLTAEIAVAWTLLHCHRMSFSVLIEWNTLIKYLSKILRNPAEPKYRRLRLSNPIFSPVWNSPLRGLLLAAGFVEHHEYLFLGRLDDPLPRERVQELAQLVYHLEQWKRYHDEDPTASVEQPEGADGFGRAGYGRPGLNL